MVNNGVIRMQGENQNATCNISKQSQSGDVVIMSHTGYNLINMFSGNCSKETL